VADPAGYDLFVIMSVLVSISFAPILLSSSPVPVFETTRRMTLKQLFEVSPLGCVGMFLLGTTFGCLFGMGSVYAAALGLTTVEISIFVGIIYVGGMVCQIPIGWFSDRIDRRLLIMIVTVIGAAAGLGATLVEGFVPLVVMAFVIGGMANPLYSLLAAYVNDYLEHEDMASASGGMILLNGIGALSAPVAVGYVMAWFGNGGFFLFITVAFSLTALYAAFRMTQRPTVPVTETGPMVAMSPVASPVATDVAWEAAIEAEQEAAAGESEAAVTG
ncbi:MAG: MFS transporter, partial [Pseudomonadota bacterium]